MKSIKVKKIVSYFLLLCMLFTLVLPVSTNVQAAEVSANMVTNPGFELPLADGKIPGWNFYYGSAGIPGAGITCGISNTLSSEGTNSLYISDTGSASVVAYSDAINVEQGKKYQVKAKIGNKSGTVSFIVRFFTNGDGYPAGAISGADVKSAALVNGTAFAEYIMDVNTIPANATHARVMLYTSSTSQGKANIDEVSFTPVIEAPPSIEYTLEDLGSTIHTVNNHRAVFGKDQNGNLMAYSTLVGMPAKLIITDVKTAQVVAQLPIEDTFNGTLYTTQMIRGLSIEPDGTVYMCGTPGDMYKYVPGSQKVQYIVAAPGQTFDMKNGPEGILVGGTYNKSIGFEFDTRTNKMTSLGRMMDTEMYSYSVAYDAKRNDYYFGIGSHGHLIKYDRDTGTKTEIALPEAYAADVQFVYDMTIAGDKLFMWLSPMQRNVVYDLETQQYESLEIRASSRHFSEQEPGSNRIYFTSLKTLYYYDTDKKEFISLDVTMDGDPIGFTFAELNDPDYPGTSLVAFTREGRLFKYNPLTGNNSCVIVPIVGEPTKLQTVEKGYDGSIHTSGYLNGGNAILDILTGVRSEFTNETRGLGQKLPQTDRIFTYKDMIYYTTYPQNMIWKFDPNRPWIKDDTENSNPKMVYSGYYYGDQDRGLSGVMIEEQAKLVVGSVPKYGMLGGALTVYDVLSDTGETFYNIIDKQSITALAYKDGLVYGGSSVWGGLGQVAEATEAKLFIWDLAKKEVVFEMVPVPGENTITELIVGPDGNLWGVNEGTLFIFDPAAKKVIFTKQIADINYTSAAWRDAQLQIGTDGNVYGVLRNDFFKIDAVTKEYASIRNNGQRNWLAQDDFGNFYLTEETNLLKITIPELIVKPVGAELTAENSTLGRDEQLNISITGILEKGRTINMLEKRNPQLFSSDLSVISPENGKLVAKNFGEVEVWAVVNINGNSFTTNRVKVSVVPKIIGIQPVDVSTYIGLPPVLPSIVNAVYDDNTQMGVEVTWKEVAPEIYSQAGSFTVQGSVTGTSISAKANVTVMQAVYGQSITVGGKSDISGTAVIQIKAEDMLAAMKNTQTKEIDINIKTQDGVQKVVVNIPAEEIKIAGEYQVQNSDKQIKSINVNTGFASIYIDPDTFNKLLNVNSSNVEITVAKVDTSILSDIVKEKVGSNTVYEFSLSVDGMKISKFDGNEVTVSFDYALNEGEQTNKVIIYYIDNQGDIQTIKDVKYSLDTGKVEFKAKLTGKYAASYAKQ